MNNEMNNKINCNKYDKTKDFYIERVHRDSNYNTQKYHYHPYYEIGFLVSGCRNMTIDHSIYFFNKGNVVFISTGEIHKGYPVEHNPCAIELVNICFVEKYLEPFFEIYGGKEKFLNFFSNHIINIPAGRYEYVKGLLQKMIDEHKKIDELSKFLVKTYFNELIAFLIRCSKNACSDIVDDNESDKIISDAVKYIYYNYNKDISLDDIAKKFNLSKSYFSRKFKAVTGFGYKEYITSVRLKKACDLLLDTDDSITEIAEKCGFNDSNYFGDAFRKVKGVSPNKYRKNKGVV